MSKDKLSTREIIVEKALEMFNAYGIENVGVRELAKELGMKGGNITYYFPTKDDLVLEISSMLGAHNNEVIVRKDQVSIDEVMQMFSDVFNNHYKFRCLFTSLANLLKQHGEMRDSYRKRALLRRDTIIAQMEELIKGGYLKLLDAKEIETLYNSILIISRFWIPNASVEEALEPVDKVVKKYLGLIAGLLSFNATAKGKKQLDVYLHY